MSPMSMHLPAQQLDAMQSKLLDLETRIINLEGPQGRTA